LIADALCEGHVSIFEGSEDLPETRGDNPCSQQLPPRDAINLKAAKALGLDVPALLQQRADEVTE
jgi:hypothetical protein